MLIIPAVDIKDGLVVRLYQGDFNKEFVQQVKENQFASKEGVVIKGCEGKPPHGIWMCKVKTNVYIQKLKDQFGVGWKAFQ
mgnify:CR=1 FL=1